MKRCARMIAIGVAMGILGFFVTVGVLTVLLAPGIDSFALKTSADAAGWVQAIGSIVAIVAAYFIGADQAHRASENALRLYRLDKARTEEGCRAIVLRLRGEVSILRRECANRDAREFRDAWNGRLRAPLNATLQAFDNMPLHEIGGWQAVLLAFEIRAGVVRFREDVDAHVAHWYAKDQIGDSALDDAREAEIDAAHASLREMIETANVELGELLTVFHDTKSA